MQTILFTLSAISIFCAPQRAGVFTMEGTTPHIQKCEKQVWACIDKTRKEQKGMATTTELEKCFR